MDAVVGVGTVYTGETLTTLQMLQGIHNHGTPENPADNNLKVYPDPSQSPPPKRPAPGENQAVPGTPREGVI